MNCDYISIPELENSHDTLFLKTLAELKIFNERNDFLLDRGENIQHIPQHTWGIVDGFHVFPSHPMKMCEADNGGSGRLLRKDIG